jgi:4-carboxymuconolactone decarboxylase
MTDAKQPTAAEKMFRERLPLMQGLMDRVDKEFSDVLNNDVLNQIYGREEKLDIKTRELCTLTMLSVLNRLDDLKNHLGAALNLGWSLDEMKDCLLLCCLPGGWPAAIDGVRLLYLYCKEMELAPPAPGTFRSGYHSTDWLKKGTEYGIRFWGEPIFNELISKYSLEGKDFKEFIIISVYGKLLSREVLDERTKRLCMIAAFAALKSHEHLKFLISGSLENGVTKEEVKEVLFYCGIYAGQEATLQAFDIYRKCLASV